jgi:hypothetical protein
MVRVSPRAVAYGLACIAALALAGDLLWMPIQVSDSLGEILSAQESPSAMASFIDGLDTRPYLRPLRIAQIKLLFDASGGKYYWEVFRGFHALLTIAAMLLFARALRVSSAIDLCAFAFALVVLIGLHTFLGNVQEAFPINHFLEIAFFCLLILNLARSRGGRWVDAAALAVFIAAALTLESGLLVWVVAAAAWMVGWRGISRPSLTTMTVLVLVYAYIRFVYLATGVPTFSERSSAYLASVLEPAELEARFGARPALFYVYNVVASALSVLFSEPQAGLFKSVGAWRGEQPLAQFALPVVTSTATTILIAWAGARRIGAASFDDTARFIVVFGAILGASAALSFAYTKDEVMSAAGAFYGLAAFGACRDGLLVTMTARRTAAVAGIVTLGLLVAGWSVRTAGVHYVLRSQAVKHQVDWLGQSAQWRRPGGSATDAARNRLIQQLQDQSLAVEFPNPRLGPAWPTRIWVD